MEHVRCKWMARDHIKCHERVSGMRRQKVWGESGGYETISNDLNWYDIGIYEICPMKMDVM